MARRRKGNPVHGWLVLDKPYDMTSNQALGKVKWLFKPQKAGHAGTLDPLATGILPIALGEATKTVPYLVDAEKTYTFTIRWGASTATQDAEGAIIARSDARPSTDAIEAALPAFIGEVDQVPPQFSAIKVDGERAYDLARDGATVELAARPVWIGELALLDVLDADTASFTMTCGKGTYVRSVVRDLCEALGVEGHVSALRRTRVGPFTEGDAVTPDALEARDAVEDRLECLRPIEEGLVGIPALDVTPAMVGDLRLGRSVPVLPVQMQALEKAGLDPDERLARAMCGREIIALGEVRAGKFAPSRVFQTGS